MEAQDTEHLPFLVIDAARNQANNFIVTATFLQVFSCVSNADVDPRFKQSFPSAQLQTLSLRTPGKVSGRK